MKCLSPIEIYPRVVVYCARELDKVDAEGRPHHDEECEPPHPMESLLARYWRDKEKNAA